MTNINFNLTNIEMISLIAEYQLTNDDAVFSQIYAEVSEMAEKIALGFYNKKRHDFDYIPADDYVSMAQYTIYLAVQEYDVTIGSPFNSFLKQRIIWALQDSLIKPACTQKEQFNTFASKNSLDQTVETSEGSASYGDVVGIQYATDIDAVFNDVFEMAEENASTDLLTEMKDLVTEFHDTASPDDSNIIKVVFSTIVSTENATAKVVNNALSVAMPEVKSATLRKRKSRAIDRFTSFAKENGFVALDLSQF